MAASYTASAAHNGSKRRELRLDTYGFAKPHDASAHEGSPPWLMPTRCASAHNSSQPTSLPVKMVPMQRAASASQEAIEFTTFTGLPCLSLFFPASRPESTYARVSRSLATAGGQCVQLAIIGWESRHRHAGMHLEGYSGTKDRPTLTRAVC